jgi:hypothetical protein
MNDDADIATLAVVFLFIACVIYVIGFMEFYNHIHSLVGGI